MTDSGSSQLDFRKDSNLSSTDETPPKAKQGIYLSRSMQTTAPGGTQDTNWVLGSDSQKWRLSPANIC